jgi:hypothetical protein
MKDTKAVLHTLSEHPKQYTLADADLCTPFVPEKHLSPLLFLQTLQTFSCLLYNQSFENTGIDADLLFSLLNSVF